jgi:ABC-type nitrate/sulfonate/bicarbonate transport system substrate-binding protein
MTVTDTSTARAQATPAVTDLWYTRCPVPTASSLAISQGWLDEEFAPDGIAVSSLRASADRAVRESHFDHTQADSFRQGGNIPPIWSRSRGRDLRLIGLSWAENFQAILALPDSGIHGPEDLRGKRLALGNRVNDQIDFWRATALRGFLAALGQVGLGSDDVRFVDVPYTETYLDGAAESHAGSLFGARSSRRLQAGEVFALIRGEVDAIYVSGGRGTDLQALLDATVVFDIGAHPDRTVRINNITPAALTVSGALLDRRPDLVTRYVASTLRAARWARTHPDETSRVIAHEVGVAEEWIPAAYPGDVHAHLEPTLDDDLVAAIESQQQFLLRWGFIERAIDVDAWIADGPLREARALVDAEPA